MLPGLFPMESVPWTLLPAAAAVVTGIIVSETLAVISQSLHALILPGGAYVGFSFCKKTRERSFLARAYEPIN